MTDLTQRPTVRTRPGATPEHEQAALDGVRDGIAARAVDPDGFGIIPASSERGGPKDMWAVTYRGQTLGRFDRFADAEANMLDRHQRSVRESEHERSVDRWAAANGVRLPDAQSDRMVKFLNDWTRP